LMLGSWSFLATAARRPGQRSWWRPAGRVQYALGDKRKVVNNVFERSQTWVMREKVSAESQCLVPPVQLMQPVFIMRHSETCVPVLMRAPQSLARSSGAWPWAKLDHALGRRASASSSWSRSAVLPPTHAFAKAPRAPFVAGKRLSVWQWTLPRDLEAPFLESLLRTLGRLLDQATVAVIGYHPEMERILA